ncbi:unnamed protein product, partial [Porites evermanni]
CLLKGGRISGFTMAHAELPVLHDALTSTIASGCQKTSCIVQFLWSDLMSGFDLIGPYIPVPKSMDSNVMKAFFMVCLKKILCGFLKATPPIDEEPADERAQYSVDMSFTNPEHPTGNALFAMLCPSHQGLRSTSVKSQSISKAEDKIFLVDVETIVSRLLFTLMKLLS